MCLQILSLLKVTGRKIQMEKNIGEMAIDTIAIYTTSRWCPTWLALIIVMFTFFPIILPTAIIQTRG